MRKLSYPSLSLFIKKAYENYGFTSAFMYGIQGSGKTTYALKVMYHVYGDWGKVLERTYFNVDKFIEDTKYYFEKDERIPVVLFDDAGLSIIKYSWRRDFAQWFSRFYNLVRTVCSAILFTSVEVTDILKFIRDKVEFRVQLVRVSHDTSYAIGYRVYTTPLLDQYVKRVFKDIVKLELPQNVREAYESMRKRAIGELYESLGETRKSEEKINIRIEDDLEATIKRL